MSPKLVPTFVDRGCRVVRATDLHGLILGFLDRSRYYSKLLLICIHEAETHYYSENLIVPGIEPGTSGSVARSSDHSIIETEPLNSTREQNHETLDKP
jgi:hypothetical protein